MEIKVVFAVVITFVMSSILFIQLPFPLLRQSGPAESEIAPRKENPLDGCLHVYLDMGSNRGIQIRKLYEPQYYPDASALPIFDEYFGAFAKRNHSEICAVGFEGNVNYENELKQLVAVYRECGWRVIIHTKTAVSTKDSDGKFFNNGVGGSIIDASRTDGSEVKLIWIARYINEIVAKRQLPPSANFIKPKVVMKLDVEGSEKEIIPDLMMSGALGHVDIISVDYHIYDWQVSYWQTIVQLKEGITNLVAMATSAELAHTCKISGIDDESYGDTNEKLPTCKQ